MATIKIHRHHLEKVFFYDFFFMIFLFKNKYSAGGKQIGAKIRAHICRP